MLPAQHVVSAQQAGQPQHGLADHSQVQSRIVEGNVLAGLDLLCKEPDEDTQQADLIPEDNALSRLQAPAFGKGEVLGIEAVLAAHPCVRHSHSLCSGTSCAEAN